MAKSGGITGGSEVDTFVTAIENAIGSTVADVITGTALANVITGGNGADTLNGLAGADIFNQGATADGADTIDGGADFDTLDYSGRSLATTCSLATGTGCGDVAAVEGDVIVINSTTTFATVENLWGAKASGTPVNTLTGDGNDNEIVGGPGADVLVGGAGNDTIQLNAIPTSVDCGTGDDSFIKNGYVFAGAVSCDVVFP
jgi:Ca2+-binding RTX toxin-like protein